MSMVEPALELRKMTEENVEILGKLPIIEFGIGDVEDGSAFNLSMFKSEKEEKKKLVCENFHMKYIGANFSNDQSHDHLKTYIIMVNKKTGKKKFFDAEIFRLHPILKQENEIDSDTERKNAMEKVLSESRTFDERQDSLTDTFGSYKRKKAMATRLRNKVSDITQVIKSSVEDLISTEGVADGAVAGEQNLSILPYNKEATEEEEIYSFQIYIPNNIRNAVSEVAQDLVNPSQEQIKEWKDKKDPRGSRYVSWHASHPHPSVQNDPDTHNEYACCLQIMTYFIKLYAPTGSVQEKEAYVKSINSIVQAWLIECFLPEENQLTLKRRLPARMKDKILAYAVVLAWHIDSFVVDILMLSEAFGMSEKKITSVVRALGGTAKVSVQGGLKRNVGMLKLPLVFPTMNKKRSR